MPTLSPWLTEETGVSGQVVSFITSACPGRADLEDRSLAQVVPCGISGLPRKYLDAISDARSR